MRFFNHGSFWHILKVNDSKMSPTFDYKSLQDMKEQKKETLYCNWLGKNETINGPEWSLTMKPGHWVQEKIICIFWPEVH